MADRNPYAPPQADAAPLLPEPRELALPNLSAPWQLVVALLLIAARQLIWILFLAAGLRGDGVELLAPIAGPALVVGSLGLAGVWRRSALARRWNVLSPFFASLFIALGGLMVIRQSHLSPSALTTLAILVLGSQILIPYLLSTRPVQLCFGLQCPACGKLSGAAVDMLYRWKACACGLRWRHVRR
jgi:hypothetical protein